MAANIGTVVIGMKIATDQLSKGITTAKGMLSSLTANFKSLMGGVNAVNATLAAFGAAIGAGVVVNAITASTKAAMEHIDASSKLANVTGLTTEMLVGLEHAANLSGLSTEELAKNIQTFNRRLGETAAGTGDALKDIDKYGFSVESLLKKPLGAAFLEAADGLANIKDDAVRAAAAFDLFGKAGASTGMLTLVKDGSKGIMEMQRDAALLLKTFNQVEGQNVEAANDALTRAYDVLGGIGVRLAVEIAPYIKVLADDFVEWGTTGSNAADLVKDALGFTVYYLGLYVDGIHLAVVANDAFTAANAKAAAVTASAIAGIGTMVENLVNMIPGIHVSFAETLNKTAASLNVLANDTGKKAWDKFLDETPTERLKRLTDNLKNGTFNAAEAAARNMKKLEQAATKALETATKKAGDLIDKMKAQVATFGMGSTAAEIYQLQQDGVNSALINQAKALDKQLKGLEASKKAMEELAEMEKKQEDKAKSIFEATRTPVEKFKEEMEELHTLFDKGLIDDTTFNRAFKSAQEKLGDEPHKNFGEALESGSAAARSLAIKDNSSSPAGPINRLAEQARQQHAEALQEQRKATAALEKIAGDNFTTLGFGNVS